jgi:hypothetical protein
MTATATPTATTAGRAEYKRPTPRSESDPRPSAPRATVVVRVLFGAASEA